MESHQTTLEPLPKTVPYNKNISVNYRASIYTSVISRIFFYTSVISRKFFYTIFYLKIGVNPRARIYTSVNPRARFYTDFINWEHVYRCSAIIGNHSAFIDLTASNWVSSVSTMVSTRDHSVFACMGAITAFSIFLFAWVCPINSPFCQIPLILLADNGTLCTVDGRY